MKKILIVSTVSRQFYLFEQGNIEVLKSLGFEVHCAANFEDASERLDSLDIERHHFDIQRSPFSLKNLNAYKQLKRIMHSEKFNAVHCHSPMGGVLARLAAKSVGIETVIYTAHGFHFYKGASWINWIIYYPVEKLLSRITDIIITINKEDYERIKLFKAGIIEYIPGVGLNTKMFKKDNSIRLAKRRAMNISEDTFLMISVGELNDNKNHIVVIKALAELSDRNFKYLICGIGKNKKKLELLIKKCGLEDSISLIGFRNDVKELYSSSDLFIFPSYREGLSVSLMEAMASGLPVIASEIRGNVDLIQNGVNGFLHKPSDFKSISNSIKEIIDNISLRNKMSEYNIMTIKKYDNKIIKEKMHYIYRKLL